MNGIAKMSGNFTIDWDGRGPDGTLAVRPSSTSCNLVPESSKYVIYGDWQGRISPTPPYPLPLECNQPAATETAVTCSATILPENVIITSGDTPQISQVAIDPYKITLSYGEVAKIKYNLSRDANVSITIGSSARSAVPIMTGESQAAGYHEITWNGFDMSDETGKKLIISSEGSYIVNIQAVNPISGSNATSKGSLQITY
jgi:hypothetical protein